jgi:acyl-CoA thioester hydrolase
VRDASHEVAVAVRWTDFDALGHLTHAVAFEYLDEARDALLRELVGEFDAWPTVVVHVRADFRRELGRGPRELVVRTRIVEVGRSSIRFAQEIVAPGGETAVEAEAVLVAWDPAARARREIDADDRTRLLPNA